MHPVWGSALGCGSWSALRREGVSGSPDGERLIATVGINDLIVVDTDDALLIYKKDSAGDVKKILENLPLCEQDRHL